MALTNEGADDISQTFYIDLKYDGIFVERFRNDGLQSKFSSSVTDWPALQEHVRVNPGDHVIELIIDSTNLIEESIESDNTITTEFVVVDDQGNFSAKATPQEKLPDLIPATPDNWSAPIIATSYSGSTVDGPLSVDETTFVRFAAQNAGQASSSENVWTYLFIDDLLVDSAIWRGALADQTLRSLERTSLSEVVRISPGPHTLRLEIDPTNLIAESDETNNVFERQLIWEAGPVPEQPVEKTADVPEFEIPVHSDLPNLVPGWKFGQDGPIIVSHDKDTTLDSQLTTDHPPYIDLVVQNRSVNAARGEFAFDLYFDGIKVRRFNFSGRIPAGAFMRTTDWGALYDEADVSPRPHTLRLVIDPNNTFDESNEDDNVFEKTFVWKSGQLLPVQQVTYSDEQLLELIGPIKDEVFDQNPVVDDNGAHSADRVIEIADAAYYLMTGRSLKDERVEILLLSESDYISWIDDLLTERLAITTSENADGLVASFEKFKQAPGFKTRRFGEVFVVVNAERGIGDVVNAVAHELGHFRQDLINPAQTEARESHMLKGVQEAQAQQFQRAFWLTIQDFAEVDLLSYPQFENFARFVDSHLAFWNEDFIVEEHSLGYLIQWMAALEDAQLSDLRDDIDDHGSLNARWSLQLFDRLVDLSPDDADDYVRSLLSGLEDNLKLIATNAVSRLTPSENLVSEGPVALRIPSLLMP